MYHTHLQLEVWVVIIVLHDMIFCLFVFNYIFLQHFILKIFIVDVFLETCIFRIESFPHPMLKFY